MGWRRNSSDYRRYSRRTALTASLLVVLFTSATKGQNVNAPVWSGVMLPGQEVQYFQYNSGSATEIATSIGFGGSATAMQLATTSRPPVNYTVLGGTSTGRSTCVLADWPSKPIYWYSDGSISATHIGSQNPPVFPSSHGKSRLSKGLKETSASRPSPSAPLSCSGMS